MLLLRTEVPHNLKYRSLFMALTLLQSMRCNKSFADFTVLGSQYENEDGIREWHVAIWSESYTKIRTYCVSEYRRPERLVGAYLKAVDQAISKWEAQPVWARYSEPSALPRLRPALRLSTDGGLYREKALSNHSPLRDAGQTLPPQLPKTMPGSRRP